mgnify:CR=1 FL=1
MQIRLENLLKKFNETTAVDHVNITFQEGALTALLGPSGCGKSTILNMIAGILPPTDGKIYFGENDVAEVPMEKRGVGMVFQNYSLYPHMTVLQNICFPLESKKELKKAARIERAKELAKLTRVDELLSRRPGELSGGQQQRVAIARALAKEPEILLLDEPLSNLDARLRLEMREEIRRIQQETHVTAVFVTHDQEEAMSISDEVVLLKGGTVQQVAAPQTLYDNPSNQFAATFLGNPPICIVNGIVQNGRFMAGNTPVRWDGVKHVEEGRKVALGIRSEALKLSNTNEEADFEATIQSKYIIGRDALAVVELNGQPVRFYLTEDLDCLSDGDLVSLTFRNKGVFLFDCETGARLS